MIQVYVTEDLLLKALPKNHFLRLLCAALVGLIFPVCECAIIPITRGLLKKGMPIGPAIAFMLATPIVNPIVLLSTWNAFPTLPQMMPLRAVCGLIGAVSIGALVSRTQNKAILKEANTISACACGHQHTAGVCRGQEHGIAGENEAYTALKTDIHETGQNHNMWHETDNPQPCDCGHQHAQTACCGEGHTESETAHSKRGTLQEVLSHTSAELRSVGVYLIFGAMIAAFVQMAAPAAVLASVGGGRILSILVMMALAFVLSLCSEADAFVASTFLFQFSGASVLAFLIVGPMVDIKNMLMMLGSFRKGFVGRLIATILLVCFALALVVSFLFGGVYA